MKKTYKYSLLGLVYTVAFMALAQTVGQFVPAVSECFDYLGLSFLTFHGTVISASLFGCGTIAERSCNDCPIDEPNKIVHVAFVKNGVTINNTTPSLLMSTLLAAELACNAYIIRGVSGAKAEPSYSEGKGRGKGLKTILAASHTVTIIDFDYINNANFWNKFKKYSQSYYMIYFTSNYAWIANKPMSVKPGDPITDDLNTFIEASIVVEWSSIDNPLPYPANVDDLEDCQSLFDFSTLLGFQNTSGSEADITNDPTGDTINIDSNDIIAAALDTGVSSLSTVEVNSGSLPTGVTLAVSGDNILISGTPTVAGTYNIVVRGCNSCSICGEFPLTIIVS